MAGAQTVGWVGTGRMGAAMVRRLLAGGCDVAAFNRTPQKLEPLVAAGAKPAASIAELAGREVVFVCVAASSDLLEVMSAEGGLLSGEAVPSVIVDCSTVSAEASAEARALAEARGCGFLAAPVSGNPKVVRAGRATMAVSGPKGAFEAVEAYLEMIGTGVTYVGEGEVARLVKLCHNLFLGVVIQSLAEVTVLAEKGGVERAAFLDFLNKSVMGSPFTAYKSPGLVNLDFTATFTSTLLQKDFDLGIGAARSLGVPMPVGALVHQQLNRLVNEGFAEEDFATLLLLQAQASALELVADPRVVSDGLEPADGAS